MRNELTRTEIEAISALNVGDIIEACDEWSNTWAGTVETAAPDLGIIWIRTSFGERKLIDVEGHSLRVLSTKEHADHEFTVPSQTNMISYFTNVFADLAKL